MQLYALCSKHGILYIASYFISSSNHNLARLAGSLFLISYHHQTTTCVYSWYCWFCCFLSHIIIKPQLLATLEWRATVVSYLISSSNHNPTAFYIPIGLLFLISYHHQTTTCSSWMAFALMLFLISYHHQTTTGFPTVISVWCCFLSHIIIKPQHFVQSACICLRCFLSHIIIKPQLLEHFHQLRLVVSYLISSSNHNL